MIPAQMTAATIFAVASGAGRAGLAVVRVSGSGAADALRRITGRALPAVRRMTRVKVIDPASGELLDDGLAVWFPAPASFTGEDVAELHIHGGRAAVGGLLESLGGVPGLRLAEPGEFTRRAFENGKMDLTAAEGLADLVDAETSAQRRQAVRQLRGELGRLYESWRERLLRALARLEATIDFSEEDLPAGLDRQVRREVGALESEIAAHLGDDRRGERLREGVHMTIIGPPNAGKSSLLNLLARRDAAIVSETAGTTRDVIEVRLDLGGYPLVVADTAGLRGGAGGEHDAVEREGMRRARQRARDADLRLAVFDAADWPATDPGAAELIDDHTVVTINKVDLGDPKPPLVVGGRRALAISVRTGKGIDALLARLEREAAARCQVAGSPGLTRLRHRQALEACRASLARFLETDAGELAAEDLRLAARALGRITGRVDVDHVLDVIFRDFCVGK